MRCEIARLMEKLHFTFFAGLAKYSKESAGAKPEKYVPYYDGAAFQEAIFYSGGALYDEEYIPYIKTRFADDCGIDLKTSLIKIYQRLSSFGIIESLPCA